MKTKKLKTILSTLLIALFVTLSIFTYALLTDEETVKTKDYSYTTAVCEGDTCQDYVVICNGTKIISKEPITGASITVSKDWVDPRPQELTEGFCTFFN